MSQITDFYMSWLGPPPGFGGLVEKPPIPNPTPIIVFPDPIARFDFNNYVANDSIIVNDIVGGSPATINEPFSNTFNTTDASNNYLEIYAPNNFPNPTGGITAPLLSNVAAIVCWVLYSPAGGYGQYFLDARTGASNAFWITQNGGDTIGSFFTNGKVYFNTRADIIDPTAGTPSLQTALSGWTQVVIVPETTISDDISLFMRFSGEQGMPVGVGEIAFYDAVPSTQDIKDIFNDNCARYGLSPV